MTEYTEKVKQTKELFRSQQEIGKVEQSGSKDKIVIEKEAQTFPIRDEQGALILFEDKNAPGLNINRRDQMITVPLEHEVFDIVEAKKAVDIEITELKKEKTIEEKLEEFFRLYENILPQVPISGETGSIQFLVRRGSEQQVGEVFDPATFEEMTSGSFGDLIQRLMSFQSSIQSLTNTSASLVSLADSLRRQLEAMGELVLLANVSGSEGVSLSALIRIVANMVEGGGSVFDPRMTGSDDGSGTNANPMIVPILVDTVRSDVVRLTRLGVPRVRVDYVITARVYGFGIVIEQGTKRTPFEIFVPAAGARGPETTQFAATLTLKDQDTYAFSGWYKNNEEFSHNYTAQLANEPPRSVVTMSVGFDMFDGEDDYDPLW